MDAGNCEVCGTRLPEQKRGQPRKAHKRCSKMAQKLREALGIRLAYAGKPAGPERGVLGLRPAKGEQPDPDSVPVTAETVEFLFSLLGDAIKAGVVHRETDRGEKLMKLRRKVRGSAMSAGNGFQVAERPETRRARKKGKKGKGTPPAAA